MTLAHIDHAHSVTPRLETLLIAQQQLKRVHRDDHMEFEVERAIEALAAGEPTSHTRYVEAWCQAFIGGA